MPDILAYSEREEGRREFAGWKERREAEKKNRIRTKGADALWKRLFPPLLHLWDQFLRARPSQFGGRIPLQSITGVSILRSFKKQ